MRSRKLSVCGVVASFVLAALSPCASGAIISYATPAGSMVTGPLPVSAKATFTTLANEIKITLTNLQANPTSVVEGLSRLEFTVSTGQTSGTLLSGLGTERTIAGDGTYSDAGSTTAAGWPLFTAGSQLDLDLLGSGGAGPSHVLLGPPNGSNVYSNANGSIAGNGPHNPFLGGTATFDISVPGVTTALSTISAVTFSFGTSHDSSADNDPGTIVPEPASMSLALTGLLSAAGLVAAYRGKGRRGRHAV